MKHLLINAKSILVLMICLLSINMQAQSHTQTIRGTIIDKDSQLPLIGANVLLPESETNLGSTTDIDGNFKLENIPVGRINLAVSYIGYEPLLLRQLLVTSGKELVLHLEMTESTSKMDEIVVVAKDDKKKPLNEMAMVSARSFSVEETSRYAASMYDPARMAQNYAGVTMGGSGDDLFNEIIVRGNSPAGLGWRLEGVEIPNPNHFSSLGGSGGAISMLSSSTLSNSDFYTGAFPAEMGNALSGVFDLKLRNGNNQKREHSFMFGAMGVELATEGPFSKKSGASYLVNYRYSTLSLLSEIGLSPVGDLVPTYQDISFKLNFPMKKGSISVFGLGGNNAAVYSPESDSTKWANPWDALGYSEVQNMGILGVTHKHLLTDKSYIQTSVAGSLNQYVDDAFFMVAEDNYRKNIIENSTLEDKMINVSSVYNLKLDAKNVFKGGFSYKYQNFKYNMDRSSSGDFTEPGLTTFLKEEGNSDMAQGFAAWKHRLNKDWTINGGVHFTHNFLTNSSAIEPRAAVKWQFRNNQAISSAVGLHARPEHASFYLMEMSDPESPERVKPNLDLEMTKALHTVLSYDYNINSNLRLNTEVYYQHLYDVPVATNDKNTASALNLQEVWDYIDDFEATNDGTGRNYGIDVTLEKFFSNNYYFLVTGSLYDSKFTTIDGREFNTRYNSNFQTNILGGKEFKVGKNKNNIIGINAKVIYAGGPRVTPIDLEATRQSDVVPVRVDEPFSAKVDNYFRTDLGVSYKWNRKNLTHTFLLDVQNVTNNQNPGGTYYDAEAEEIKIWTQTGLFPTFNYRIEF